VCVQAVAYIPPHQPHLTQAMIRWTAATMWAVKSMVRPKSPLKDELKGECMSLRQQPPPVPAVHCPIVNLTKSNRHQDMHWTVPDIPALCMLPLYNAQPPELSNFMLHTWLKEFKTPMEVALLTPCPHALTLQGC
jgi:hypothetical protein